LKYDAIIFDVSDTLVEYSPNYAQIYGDRLRSLNFEVSQEKAKEISRAINWAIGEQNQKEQYGGLQISNEELITLLDDAALTSVINKNISKEQYLVDLSELPIPEQEMTIIPGVINVLTVLKSKYHLAIVSNHHSWLMDYLRQIGLASYFESIVISDIVGVAKPNIRIMQIVLEELGLKPDQCLYVGDQPLDVLCSKQVGMEWIVLGLLQMEVNYQNQFLTMKTIGLVNYQIC